MSVSLNTTDQAIVSRKSVRGFLDKPVPREMVEHILRNAARAPSGNNSQPWSVSVLSGEPLKKLTDELVATAMKGRTGAEKSHAYEYDYYPEKWVEPFLSRRRKVGFDLYAKLGIAKEDIDGRQRQFEDNYRFFGAPVGMFVFLDRSMGHGGYLDTGMFIQNILTGARGHGLDTCAQAAFSAFHMIIYRALQTPAHRMLLCGIALGYADPHHPANQLITERAALNDFVDFHGFENP